jgi:hypothetical protein
VRLEEFVAVALGPHPEGTEAFSLYQAHGHLLPQASDLKGRKEDRETLRKHVIAFSCPSPFPTWARLSAIRLPSFSLLRD